MISVRQEIERETRPGGYAEAPNFHLHGNSDDDQADTISESESNCSEQWNELDGQEREALISLRDARKKLQHATKSRRFYSKGGGRARSTGKSIDELDLVIEVFPSSPNQTNKTKDMREPLRNLSATPQSNMRKQIPTTNTNLDLTNIDHVTSSGTHHGSYVVCLWGQ